MLYRKQSVTLMRTYIRVIKFFYNQLKIFYIYAIGLFDVRNWFDNKSQKWLRYKNSQN